MTMDKPDEAPLPEDDNYRESEDDDYTGDIGRCVLNPLLNTPSNLIFS